MQRLSGLDAGFLYMETPTLHMHTLKLAVFQPPEGSAPLPIGWIRDEISRRLHLLPPFRRRLVEVPFGLNHPMWIEDADFDIANHVRPVQLPAPGAMRDLELVVGELAGRPLDRSRPLWEMFFIQGLEGGRFAVFVKIHHAAADGSAASELLMNALSIDADEEVPDGDGRWVPEVVPPPRRLVIDALVDQARQWFHLPALLARTMRAMRALARRRRLTLVNPPRPVLDVPRTPFNTALTPRRVFATASFALADAKRVKNALGVTLNDVVLALAAGSLRAYLTERGALPAQSLVVSVPVSADKPDAATRLEGNKVSNLFTSLATDIADPVERVLAIRRVTAEAKVVQGLLGVDMMADWVQYTPPRPYAWAVQQYSRFRVADHHRPPINAVVSNVPGPRATQFGAGIELVELYSVGPVLEGIGLNITVWSYVDTLFVGVLGCRETVPDADAIAAGMVAALDELLDALGTNSADATIARR